MRRFLLLMMSLLVVWPVAAQDAPPPTPTPTLAPVLAPTNTPTVTPTATPLPDLAALLTDADALAQLRLRARGDLELLANATLGPVDRPAGWRGNYDVSGEAMPLDLRLDLELLADAVLDGTRPAGWFGIQPSTPFAFSRDVRHDLELLADQTVAPSVRPPNWTGDDPMMRCDRATQTLVTLLTTRGLYTPSITPASPTYCTELTNDVSLFTEMNLIEPPPAAPAGDPAAPASGGDDAATPIPTFTPTATPVPPSVSANGAAGYYDFGLQSLAGTVPGGAVIEPIARSTAPLSRMMLVRGEGFVLFVDYAETNIDAATFELLGDVNVISYQTACEPEWCGAAN